MKRLSHLSLLSPSRPENSPRVSFLLLLTGLALSVVEGCGGGSIGPSAGSGQDQIYGPFQTRAAGGKPQTITSSINGPTITGIAGAAFTKITYAPAPNPANSRIAFIRNLAGTTLNIVNADGSNLRSLPGVAPIHKPTWSRDGRLAFDAEDYSTGRSQIYVVNSDGTNLHKISDNTSSDIGPSWSPDNFHIAFYRIDGTGHFQIYTMTSSGGSVTHADTGTSDDSIPGWSADGSQIVFFRLGSGTCDIWTENANGTSQTAVTSGDLFYNSLAGNVAVAPYGTRICATLGNTANYDVGEFVYPSGIQTSIPLGNTGTDYFFQGWSPDGSRLLVTQHTSGANELDSYTNEGGNRQQIVSYGDNTIGNACWEPYPTAIPYISSTGGYTVSNASSGFLYGLNGSQLTSFLNFTATTPSSTTLSVDPVTAGSTNVTYHIHADALTSVKFVNGFGGGLNVVSLGAGVQQALISFNASDGTVASVLPVASKQNPIRNLQAANCKLQANFTGVYNAKGVNLAPHGAREVTLNKSGEVVSIS